MKPPIKIATLSNMPLVKIQISSLQVQKLEIATVIHACFILSTHNGVEDMIQTSSTLRRCAAHAMAVKPAMMNQWFLLSLKTLYKLWSMLQLMLPIMLKIWLLMLVLTRES